MKPTRARQTPRYATVAGWMTAMAVLVAFGAVLLHNPAVEAG